MYPFIYSFKSIQMAKAEAKTATRPTRTRKTAAAAPEKPTRTKATKAPKTTKTPAVTKTTKTKAEKRVLHPKVVMGTDGKQYMIHLKEKKKRQRGILIQKNHFNEFLVKKEREPHPLEKLAEWANSEVLSTDELREIRKKELKRHYVRCKTFIRRFKKEFIDPENDKKKTPVQLANRYLKYNDLYSNKNVER